MKAIKWTMCCLVGFLLGAGAVWWLFPKLGLPLLGVSSQGRLIDAVIAHPLFDRTFVCSEHPAGQFALLGDDLGQDCVVMDFVTRGERTWLESYRTDGTRNADWFGWSAPVLSPCECTVLNIHRNPIVNEPGRPAQSRAASITLKAQDGTHFVLAHLGSFVVKVGDTVRRGQKLGTVGNNGFSRAPHIHIGAWQGRRGLQLRWDQQKLVR